jgi:hypothetical protein
MSLAPHINPERAGSALAFRPRAFHLLALMLCAVAALLLLWPLLTGQLLFGGARSDMFIAGYSFRLFGAQTFLDTGSIPQWNPYLYGGLPYIGAMHGDIFYPTAWLRWIMPVDLAITWGMAIHFVLAGWFMYRLCCALGLTWGASVFAGIAYELSGIVASQMSPGHDGKLFVSALAPLAFWTLRHAIRREQTWAFGAFAFIVGLIVLGHYHMAYFLFIALGLWTLYLVYWDPERPRVLVAWKALGLAALAVAVGAGIAGLQLLPFFEYIPFSPRAAGGRDTGWEFATSYAFPPEEMFSLLLPEFNGVLEHYWGRNGGKLHTEYMGFLPLALAALALGDVAKRRLVVAFGAGAVLFLMFSFAGHTPLYRPFFEFLPLLKKVRAMGMVYYLTAFALCVLAGIGMDRVIGRAVPLRTVLLIVGGSAAFALLGAVGALQGLAESLAIAPRADAAFGNAASLQAGALRLLASVALGGATMWAAAAGRLKPIAATVALLCLLAADLWSVNRKFFVFSARASILFADDAITSSLRAVRPPYRVFDAGDSYRNSILMAYGVPVALGYHGFELQRYNELTGANTGYESLVSPNLLDLLAIRFLILRTPQTVLGYHLAVGPITTTFGTPAVLYERDSAPPYARVMKVAAKIPEAQVITTLPDPRFPVNLVALLPDSSTSSLLLAKQPFLASPVTADVREWAPGAMTIALSGEDTTTSLLVVSENWYPDWSAVVDGEAGVVRRANHTLIGVDVPAGAKQVQLTFQSDAYKRGKLLSLASIFTASLMLLLPAVGRRARERRATAGSAT